MILTSPTCGASVREDKAMTTDLIPEWGVCHILTASSELFEWETDFKSEWAIIFPTMYDTEG